MNSPYHEGINARKANKGRHENPYQGQKIEFMDWAFNPRIHSQMSENRYDWDEGWMAEDKWIRG